MPNARLRAAMEAAHVDMNKLATEAQVDIKTVERWIKGRIPHLRHQWRVAELLKVHEDILWPVNRSEEEKLPGESCEIIAAYAHRANTPLQLWWQLISQATKQIDILGYAFLFLPEQHAGLIPLLKQKCETSCKIRIAIADPTCEHVQERDKLEQLGGTLPDRIRTTMHHFRELLYCPGVEMNYHQIHLYNAIYRFDGDMLVTPYLYQAHGFQHPLLHLRNLESDGIFANFANQFETIWATTTPIECDFAVVTEPKGLISSKP